jgi:hypothetical protein
VKTKSDLVDEINGLIGAVGDKFDAEKGDPERDYMAAHCPNRLEAIARRLPTLSMHLLAHIAKARSASSAWPRAPINSKARCPNTFSAWSRPDSSTAPRYRLTGRRSP